MATEEEEEEELEEMDHNWHFRYNRRLSIVSHAVTNVNFSQDGRWFVSGTATGEVTVWDTICWAEAAKLKGGEREGGRKAKAPQAIVISPAQRWLVVAYAQVLNIFECKPPWRFEQALEASVDVASKEPSQWHCIAFSPMAEVDHPKGGTGQDNHLCAFSTKTLSVMDYSGGWGPELPKRTRSMLQTEAQPTSLAYTSDGGWLVCGFDGGQIQIWNACSLTLEKSLTSHTGSISCLAVSPRSAPYSARFVSCSVDQTLRVWHCMGWMMEQICPDTRCDRSGVRTCTFSSTGNWLVSVSTELIVWKVCVVKWTGRLFMRMHQRMSASCGAEGVRVAALCCLNDALAVGSRDGILGLWCKQHGAPVEQPAGRDYSSFQARAESAATSTSRGDGVYGEFLQGPRPMLRLSPDGIRPAVSMSAMMATCNEGLFQRNGRYQAMRPLKAASSTGGLTARRRSSLGLGGLAIATPPMGSPVGSRKGMVARSKSDGAASMLSAGVERQTAIDSACRRAAAFSYGDVLGVFASANAGLTPLPSGPRASAESPEEVVSDTRKLQIRACRGLVQRIVVQAQAIPGPFGEGYSE